MQKYDVLIIGGGPGGCMAALHAAEKGISVCLLEKTRDIGYPVRCGEALGEEAVNTLCYYLFETLKVKTIIASINSNNISSIKQVEKLGFQFLKTEKCKLKGNPAKEHQYTFTV